MATSTAHQSTGDTIPANRIIQSCVIAAIAALAINLPVYFLVPTLFNFALDVPLMGPGSEIQHLPINMVIIAIVVAATGAGLLLAALQRFTKRPVTFFRTIAVVLLVLSFGAIFSLSVAFDIQMTLVTLHTITAVIIIYALTIWRHEHATSD